ncbi:ATP-binding protein [Azohydromonas aeria]|uniref:ATP-binding protein n=1 Tax=Azohydromonas aeria TaxID=2590212 RepID=UPI0012F92893|nr:ATP-binding protein [Azohydromonas aeria]
MTIRTRLLLIVLAVWLPAVISFALLARFTYLREVGDAREHVQQMAENVALALEQALERRAETARLLAASLALRDADLHRFHAEARAAVRDSGDWVFLADRGHQLLNTLREDPLPTPLPRAQGAPFVETGPALYYSDHGPLLRKPVLALFAPERHVAPPRWNVGVSFPFSVLQELVQARAYPEGSVAAVINRDQVVLARSRDPEKWVGVRATGDLQRRAVANDTGFAESVTLDGVPSLTYLGPADRWGCRVVIALPQATLTAAAKRLTLQAFAAAGVLLVLGLLAALAAARRISAPMHALHRAALGLGRDEVPPRLDTGVREADAVSAALHEAGTRIGQATRTLECRVAEAVQQAREAQEKLLTAQKHEALGRLTGGLAHDFNNLLQTISTAHHVLDRVIGDGSSAGGGGAPRRVLDGAMRATARAADLIRQMLAFGREQPLAARAVSLGDLVLHSQELTGPALGRRIGLAADIAPALPPLFVDPAQLELALLNLVFNARDALPDGGQVRIEGRLARGDEAAGLGPGASAGTGAGIRRFACVAVADDGPGMDAATVARAFEPYFTTKPVGAGSGLGLAQVLAFARQSGGDARIDSAPGRGTRVTMLLPVCEDAAAGTGASGGAGAPSAAGPAADAATPLRVLMVEDDVLVASVVKPALEGLGHRVTLCVSADAAMAVLARGEAFDVLFTDVVMPGTMNGMDLVAWCAQHCPALPAVIATGFMPHRTAPGGARLLRKPYALGDLARALREARAAGAVAAAPADGVARDAAS